MEDKQEVRHLLMVPPLSRLSTFPFRSQMIDIIETVYRGASKGRGLVVSPKGMSLSLIPTLDEMN
jgi:hypothetical protein